MKKKISSSVVLEELVLHRVDPLSFNRCCDILNSKFRSTDLYDVATQFRSWLSDKKAVYVEKEGNEMSCESVNKYFTLKSCCKDDTLKFLATFLAEPYNCSLMIDALPTVVKETILECMDRFYIPVEEMMEKEGYNRILTKGKDRWSRDSYQIASPWFTFRKDKVYSREQFYVALLEPFFPYLFQTVKRNFQVSLQEELPSNEQFRMMLTEESAVRAFPQVKDMYDRGDIEFNNNGKMAATVFRKCVSQLGVFEEFFPETKERAIKNFRASLFLPYLYYRLSRSFLMSSRRKGKVSIEDVLRDDNKDTLLPYARLMLHVLLPHVTGITASLDISNCFSLFSDVLSVLMDYLKPATHGWISMEEFFERILVKYQGVSHLCLFSTADYSYNGICLKNSKKDKAVIPLNHIRKEISEPCVKAIFLMMASVGLFDLAFQESRAEDTSWVDGLKYARLTDLGKYVFGLSSVYNPCFTQQQQKYFDVDPERLIIRSLVENNPYESFLCNVAQSIGNRRFVFTEESMIKKCVTKQEVESKIDFFIRFISPELSPVWKDFFDSVLEKCKPFHALRLADYSMFQVDATNKRLIRLLNTDAKLQKMVIRAEGFIFLLKDVDRKQFAERLKYFGYIL